MNWLTLILAIADLIDLGFLKNYSWLKKQKNSKPFGQVNTY